MVQGNWAARNDGRQNALMRVFAVSVFVLFISLQIGLVFHQVSHSHAEEETGDCGYCVLGSHLNVEPVSFTMQEIAGSAEILVHNQPFVTVASHFRSHSTRGPPFTSA